jgi:hypothetical protein
MSNLKNNTHMAIDIATKKQICKMDERYQVVHSLHYSRPTGESVHMDYWIVRGMNRQKRDGEAALRSGETWREENTFSVM